VQGIVDVAAIAKLRSLTLKRRFASGELTEEEYRQKKALLKEQ